MSKNRVFVEALEPICLFDVEPIDPGFANNGSFLTDLGSGGQKYLSKVLVQPDGKILASSDREYGIDPNGLSPLIRLNADGTPDQTFGSDGQAVLFGGTDAIVRIKDIALDSQGRIVVTGDTTGLPYRFSYVIERFLPNGSPDVSFGNQGTVVFTPPGGTLNGDDLVNSITIDSQGRILVGGDADGVWGIVRLLADGTPDSTFGAGGFASMNASGTFKDMLPAPDGDVYAVGTDVSADNGYRMTAIRLLDDGSPDPTFGSDGVIYRIPHLQGSDSVCFAQTAMLRPDGRLIIGGIELNATLPLADADVYSVMPDGSADPTFGTGGLVASSLGAGFSNPQAMILRPDGTIVIAGTYGVGQDLSALEAFNPDGTPLATFGTNGIIGISEFSGIADMTQDAQGRIIIGGSLDDSFTQVEIGRYIPFPILEVGTDTTTTPGVTTSADSVAGADISSASAFAAPASNAIVSAATTGPQFVLSRTGDLSKSVGVTVLFTGIGSNGVTQKTDSVSNAIRRSHKSAPARAL